MLTNIFSRMILTAGNRTDLEYKCFHAVATAKLKHAL